jgi:hypothetical protein
MTYQRPAYEEVRIAHGGSTVTLRPTLRAAVTLEARFGFPTLFRALDEGSFTIISEIIRVSKFESSTDAAAFLSSQCGRPLSPFFQAVRAPLTEFVSMLTPAPDPMARKTLGSGKPMPWSDYYAALYGQATGWLGWTPEQTWNATPTEIDRAYAAHIEMLKSIHGSETDKKQADPEQAERNIAAGLDPEFDRAGLQALKSMGRPA